MSEKFNKSDYDIQYAKDHLKRIPLNVTIEMNNRIKAHASQRNESVSGFIKRAIIETMARDNEPKN
jgi:hypothetical protein